MSEIDVDQEASKLDKVKKVVKNNWKSFTIGAVLTGVTFIVAKRVVFPNRTQLLIEKMIIKDNVFLIETWSRRMGPPSYLVECLETGEKWTAQSDLARELGISASRISARFKETNGAVAVIDGLHYIRRAMAIPRSG